MSFKPSQPYFCEFTISNPTTGAATNADSLPVATANHNGTDDSGFVLTVANIDTGRYKITGTVPSGYASHDVVSISVAATVSSVTGKSVVDHFTIDTKYVSDLNDSPYNGGAVASVSGNVGGNVTGSVGSVTGAVASVTGAVGSVTGNVNLNLTQAVPTSNTAQTVGDALNAARAQGFGKWAISGTSLTLYAGDGTTVVRTFTLDSSSSPTTRT